MPRRCSLRCSSSGTSWSHSCDRSDSNDPLTDSWPGPSDPHGRRGACPGLSAWHLHRPHHGRRAIAVRTAARSVRAHASCRMWRAPPVRCRGRRTDLARVRVVGPPLLSRRTAGDLCDPARPVDLAEQPGGARRGHARLGPQHSDLLRHQHQLAGLCGRDDDVLRDADARSLHAELRFGGGGHRG
jgi:hypothetical protein